MKDWQNKEVKCVHDTGTEIKVGDSVQDHNGTVYTVKYLEPPKKPFSQGKIYCEVMLGARYASVFNCKFVEVN